MKYYKQQSNEEKKKVKPFASIKTLTALRVTMKSLTEIIDMLFTKFSDAFRYVLTGTLNQDCLEVRKIVGDKFIGFINSFLISLFFESSLG